MTPIVLMAGGVPPAAEITPETIELLLYVPWGMPPSVSPGIGEIDGALYLRGRYLFAAAISVTRHVVCAIGMTGIT